VNFGQLIQKIRKEQNLDIQTLAKQTGVDASTISRIENARTQATLGTTIRICNGLEIALPDLFLALQGRHMASLEPKRVIEGEGVPKASDVEAVIEYFRQDWKRGCTWLAHLLNRIVLVRDSSVRTNERSRAQFFVAEVINNLLFDSSVYWSELRYPSEMEPDDILDIYRQNGVLTMADIGAYLKKIRREKQVTLASLEDSVNFSDSALSRLETGSMERIKLTDVLKLDEQLAQEGKILALLWQACKSNEGFMHKPQQMNNGRSTVATASWTQEEIKLAAVFTTACRWIQVLRLKDASLMNELHSSLHQLSS
jgi:transcriptional regulator with XRE-family HTH domain